MQFNVPRFKNGSNRSVCIGGSKRPGLAQPTIMPANLSQQNNASAASVNLTEQVQGTTSMGGPQYAVVVDQNGNPKHVHVHGKHVKKSPGIARPSMAAKGDDQRKVDNAPDAPPLLTK